jgi:hypothetical protein
MLSGLCERANGPIRKSPAAVAFQGQPFSSLTNEDCPADCVQRKNPANAGRLAGLPVHHPIVGAASFVYQARSQSKGISLFCAPAVLVQVV